MSVRAQNRLHRAGYALLFPLLALLSCASSAGAEAPDAIEAGASQNYFYIEPSYAGTTVALFGSIDRERLPGRAFDIAVTLRGPVKPITVWKKDRRAGLWVNSQSLTFLGVPNYYAVLSTKPLAQIASPEERKAHEIGLDALTLLVKGDGDPKAQPAAPREFQDALIRLKKSAGLYVEESESAIEFFGTRLFRATVYLPPSAGAGLYRAKFYVLQNGKVTGEAAAHIRLHKIGIEARLSSAAVHYPWLYGAIAVLLAAAVGSGASLIFRRT